jgi:hypothetical protein
MNLFPEKLLKHDSHVQMNDGKSTEEDVEAKMAQMVCSFNNREECLACGS